MASRRDFLAAASASLASLYVSSFVAGDDKKGEKKEEKKPEKKDVPKIHWHDVSSWGVEGRAWNDTARFFDRFPAKAEKTVRPVVWSLSRDSAGMLARFQTAAKSIHVRYKLSKPGLAMNHMPATGVSGVDLYARDADGKDRWLGCTRPSAQQVEEKLADQLERASKMEERLYTLYLPLYNGVDSLEIGVEEGAKLTPVAPRKDKSILFYGTSIMQGGCCSRPGMAIPAILGRRLDRPTINLGFSGNGKMEPEVGALLAELDPAVFVIDTVPNNSPAEVLEKTEPLVKQLRAARAETPILLVEGRLFANARFHAGRRMAHQESSKNLRATYERLLAAGDKHLHYLADHHLIGDDGEATVDGSHPTDLGMMRYADAYEKPLREILG